MGFFDAFTGKSAIRAANATAAGVERRTDQAFGEARDAYGRADGYFEPYGQSGTQAHGLYNDAIGLGGAEGYGRAQGAYKQSPFLADQQARTENALMKGYNARGMSMGGTAALAAARARQETEHGDYQGWLNRLQSQQQMGLGVAGQRAGIQQGLGQLSVDRAGVLNQNDINRSNAVTQARARGQQNMFSTIGNIAGSAFNIYGGGQGGGANRMFG